MLYFHHYVVFDQIQNKEFWGVNSIKATDLNDFWDDVLGSKKNVIKQDIKMRYLARTLEALCAINLIGFSCEANICQEKLSQKGSLCISWIFNLQSALDMTGFFEIEQNWWCSASTLRAWHKVQISQSSYESLASGFIILVCLTLDQWIRQKSCICWI